MGHVNFMATVSGSDPRIKGLSDIATAVSTRAACCQAEVVVTSYNKKQKKYQKAIVKMSIVGILHRPQITG